MIPEDADLAKLLFKLIKAIETELGYTVTATEGPPPGWRVLPPKDRYYFVIRMVDRQGGQLVVAFFRRPVAEHVKTIWVNPSDSPRTIIGQMRRAVIQQLIEDHTSGPS